MTDWPTIVREQGPLVWRTAYRLLNHDADAADCFQRTFLAAVELARRETVRDWSAALRRLATARALEMLRSRYRDRRFDPMPETPDPRTFDPIQAASRGELAENLRVALATIDPTQAAVFSLVCLDGRSNQDAASELGISANHAGVLLHRARQALREHLTAFDPKQVNR